MDNMNNDNGLFEALFRQAVIDRFNREIADMPSEEDLEGKVPISARQEQRMKKLCARFERQERNKVILRWTRRAAAVVVIAAALMFGALMTVPDVRAAVSDTVIQWFEQFTKFISFGAVQTSGRLEPAYIPDGFAEIDRMDTDSILTVIYMNGSGDILRNTVMSAENSLSVDNEERMYTRTAIDGVTYHIFTDDTNEKGSAVIWEKDGYRYSVHAALPADTLFEVALSVK